MASLNPVQANTLVIPIDGTAAAPSLSFGGNSSTPSGTGLYGTYGSIYHTISGTLALTLSSSGLTLASGAVTLTSGNLVLSSGNVVVPAANRLAIGDTILMAAAGVPVDGTTADNIAGKGSLYVDITNGVLYINTGTITDSTWVKVGTQS